jgi:hypothetical protein
VEEKGLLGDDAHEGAQRGHRHLAHVVAVHGEASAGDVVKAGEEIEEGGLARSRHPHEGHHLALANGQRDPREGIGLAVGVAKGHVLQRDGILEAGEDEGARRVGDGGRGVEDLEHALHRAQGLLDGVGHARELADGPVEEDHRGGEGEELARRERARDDLVAPVPERAHDADGAQHLHERLRGLIGAVVLEGEAEELIVDAVEALLLELLAAEGLHDLGAGEGLLEHHVELRHRLLGALVDLVELASQRADGDGHRRGTPPPR